MPDKLSDKEIERRKQQAESLKAAPPKPHENFQQAGGKGKPGSKSPRGRMFRHQGR